MHTDHLGSSSTTTDNTGARIGEQKYDAYGKVRSSSGSLGTSRGYTGQYLDAGTGGLMYYNARYYNPYLNRWLQPDTIVPNPGNPQDLNRYSYVRNSPLNYTDPSGHDPKNDYGESMNDNCNYVGKDCPDGSVGSIARYYRRYFPKAWNNRDKWQYGAEPRDTVAGVVASYELGVQWALGIGEDTNDDGYNDRNFGPGDPFTAELRAYDGVTDDLPKIAEKLENGELKGSFGDDLGGWQGVPKFIRNYSASLTFGATGNIAASYLGSFDGTWNVLEIDEAEGVAVVQFQATNASTPASGFRPPIIGYTSLWNNTVGAFENWAVNTYSPGPMRTMYQTIQWTYTVEFGR
jgi:RHS repeat-associated protein